MAGSRLERVGSVFTRTRDLLRAGVLKKKPVWYDIYKAFPPLREPVFRRPRLRYGKAKTPIQDIFYHEDRIRAKFYSAYGSGQKAFDMFNPNFKSVCQRCVNQPGAGLINKVAQLLGGRTHAPDTAGDSQATLFPPKPAFEDPGHFCEQQTLASTIKDRFTFTEKG
uniref:Small ribosomal subunit protein mS23 n=1 Tax=Castor canadensis TaxID=51338 RepID=A0A8B7VWT7_CASCN|nr:28S ribosomal protein S23, mitochondrial isoform X4 [Castor canadensis]